VRGKKKGFYGEWGLENGEWGIKKEKWSELQPEADPPPAEK